MFKTLTTFFLTVLTLTSMTCFADIERQFGDWFVGEMEGNLGVYAATTNDSGGILGEYCYRDKGTCNWILGNDVNCEKNHQYPILANADSGAFYALVTCMDPVKSTSRYLIEYKVIEAGIKDSSYIGLAWPMANGQFQVSRYSLNGASKAIEFMEMIVRSFKNKPKTRTDTHDFRM